MVPALFPLFAAVVTAGSPDFAGRFESDPEDAASYADLEEWVMEDELKLAERVARFGTAAEALLDVGNRFSFFWDTDREDRRQAWIDVLVAKVEADAADDAMALASAGGLLVDQRLRHDGALAEDGTFRRCFLAGGRRVDSKARDEWRALQLFERALGVASGEEERARVMIDYANALLGNDWSAAAYSRFTDLDGEMPDFGSFVDDAVPWWRYWDADEELIEGRSPAVTADGELNLPEAPADLANAETDIERARWLLQRAAAIAPTVDLATEARLDLANAWQSWFGVANLPHAGYFFIEGTESEFDPEAPGKFELHTLSDDETFLVGPDGPLRVRLPEGLSHVRLLRHIVVDPKVSPCNRIEAFNKLSEIYLDRRQADRALALGDAFVAALPDDKDALESRDYWRRDLVPDGEFANLEPFPVGSPVRVQFTSRGLSELVLEVWKLKSASEGSQLEYALFGEFRDPESWADHYEQFTQLPTLRFPIRKKPNWLGTRTEIEIPLSDPGHYVLVQRRADGERRCNSLNIEGTLLFANTSSKDGAQFFLADAATGRPVAGADVLADGEVYGSDHTGLIAGFDGGFGRCTVRRAGKAPEIKLLRSSSRFKVARAFDAEVTRCLLVTDQPLYRPGQKVGFSGWLRRPGDRWQSPGDLFGGHGIEVTVRDPTGKTVFKTTLEMDEFGAFDGSIPLPETAVLGRYDIEMFAETDEPSPGDPFSTDFTTVKLATKSIEVAEFRKPDFRVSVTGDPDADAGEFAALVEARHHSGEPVRGAPVTASLSALPERGLVLGSAEFDWLYGKRYGWALPGTEWLEGWQKWGVRRVHGGGDDWEWEEFATSHEVVVEATGTTDDEGRARLTFTQDLPLLATFVYRCTAAAEVRHSSGRVVAGADEFRYSGRDVEVFAEPERGFYAVGDKVKVKLSAGDANGEPIGVEGEFVVEQLSYAEDEARTVALRQVFGKMVETNNSGHGEVEFFLSAAGQFRCSFSSGGSERGFVINALADGFDARGLRFKPVQLTPEHSACAVGEVLRVAVHTDRPDVTVWIFESMPDGSPRTPRLVQTRGKIAVVEIPISASSAPNFFLRAVTVAGGEVESDLIRIAVPPRDRLLAVELEGAPVSAAPGDEVVLGVRVNAADGQPVQASLAVTAYDSALDGLAEPPPDARGFFVEAFELGSTLVVAGRRPDRDVSPFDMPWWSGCFDDRYSLRGEVEWRTESRFEKVGETMWQHIWDPPEIPQQFGSLGGFGGGRHSFPVTPANPTAFESLGGASRASAVDVDPATRRALEKIGARDRFADRAYWGAAVRTDAAGKAMVSFKLPENLTAWRARSWALGTGNQFGDAEAEIRVSKPLQLRPVIPRAAVVGDVLEFAALAQNLTGGELDLVFDLDATGARIVFTDKTTTRAAVAPGAGEARATWKVELREAGPATLRFVVRSSDGAHSDGVSLPLEITPPTALATVAAHAEVVPGDLTSLELRLGEAPPEGGVLNVQVSAAPGMDAFLALPDLVQYPHGCTEQTLNKFLPALIAQRTAERLGVDWETVERVFAGRAESGLGWLRGPAAARFGTKPAGLSDAKVRELVHAGVAKLEGMRLSSGAWGWFSGEGETASPYLTALAVRGLAIAEKAGADVDLYRSESWLEEHAKRRAERIAKHGSKLEPVDALIVYALSEATDDAEEKKRKEARPLAAALSARRAELGLYGQILLALSLDPKVPPDAALLGKILPEIHTHAADQLDGDNPPVAPYTNWWRDRVETRAHYLKLLARGDRGDARVQFQIRKLLSLRVDGVRWKSTRDTAFCIEAIAAALPDKQLVLDPFEDVTVKVVLPDSPEPLVAKLDGENLWHHRFEAILPGHARETVPLQVSVTGGERPVAVTASFTFASARRRGAEESGLKLTRRYRRADGSEVGAGDALVPGEKVSVELTLATDEEREFVHLSDPLPAGLEPTQPLSGYYGSWWFGRAYLESRAAGTDFFIRTLPVGEGIYTYDARVVTPGSALALPARAECMYAPAIFSTTAARQIAVKSLQ